MKSTTSPDHLGPHGRTHHIHLDNKAAAQLDALATYYSDRLGLNVSASQMLRRGLNLLDDHIETLRADNQTHAEATPAEIREGLTVAQLKRSRPAEATTATTAHLGGHRR